MECKPQVSKNSFEDMDYDDKVNVLYDLQVITMECIQNIESKLEKRKLLDRISVVLGGIAGGVLGALGLNQVK